MPAAALVILVIIGSLPGPVRAATPIQIADAIKQGTAFLYSKQNNGNWESSTSASVDLNAPNDTAGLQFGGMTAIATFALLSCGENPQTNDQLKQAVAWLEKADLRGTYALGVRSQIWNLLPEDETVRKMRRKDKERLLDGVLTHDDAWGYFGYGQGMDRRFFDHSVSQFGVLGLWSAVQGGEEIETRYWKQFDKAWRSQQQPDGAWCYFSEPLPQEVADREPPGMSGELLSMTAAGVATLFITQDYASSGARCQGNIQDANIAAGMQWVGTHLDALDSNPWSQEWRYYTLFGICRIGLASGYKYIGTNDWFQWGADLLAKEQGQDGSWGPTRLQVKAEGEPIDGSIYNTAFGLLFLSRGRAPVLFSKLQYNILKAGNTSVEANWNQRPRDVANLTRLLARQGEAQLNWQIVDLKESAGDLIDAPMLYMSGNEYLRLSPADMQKLKDYINEGGIIVGHADCDSIAFAEGFRKLGQAMFPGETFRQLPADHPVFRNENYPGRLWNPTPKLEALDNGARVRMLLIPSGDPAATWQTQSFPNMKRYTFGQMMMDIYLYAVDKQGLRTKGESFIVTRHENTPAKYKARIARVSYAGNWDPEPGGWPRLANIMHNDDSVDLLVDTVELGKGQLTHDYQLADITGTGTFTLDTTQRAELKKFVEGGGTLLMDAAGGKTAFSVSAMEQLIKTFPGTATPAVLPLTSQVYAMGDPIKEVGYREFARTTLGSMRRPQLRGIENGGRIGVFVSDEDLSVGLVGQPVDGIVGYDPKSAAHLRGT